MELIFLYINHSKTGFIEKQGINLNSHYCFEVTYENGVYTLNQKKKSEVKDCNFFDETGCISNVTAIVGENGSGKTTLLNQFMISYGGVKENVIGREIYNFNRYEDAKRIAIYVENGDIIIFHNIENLNMSQNLKDKEHYLYKGSKELSSIIKENKEFENISRFFITNNYLGEMTNSISIHDSVSDIYMNLSSLHTLKGDFFGKEYLRYKDFNGQLLAFSDMLMSKRPDEFVQQFIDCIYLKNLILRSEHTPFDKCLERDLKISFFSFYRCIEDNFYDDSNEILKQHNNIKSLINISNISSDFDKNLSVLYYNLLEFMAQIKDVRLIGSGKLITSLDELRNIVKENIEAIEKNDLKTYFEKAYSEIENYVKILSREYEVKKKFDYSQPRLERTEFVIRYGEKQYREFLNAICQSIFSNGESFIIKCINIEGIGLSSGERALLNLFSWIVFFPQYRKIRYGELGGLRDNILLLIDELDLYCHPAWQQKLIYYLLEELRIQFAGKNVQLIFTTHSPIVLSDIPKSNTVYLRRSGDGKMLIDKPHNHYETFGSNIYKLFNDAFFLEKSGQIGEFAKRKIENIIKNLWDDKENKIRAIKKNKFYELQHQIEMIGDNLLREKLLDMLFESRYSELDYSQRKIKLYQKKIEELGGNK
jgi:hypothetical protein